MRTQTGLSVVISLCKARLAPPLLKTGITMMTIATFALFASALMGATWWAIKDESQA